MSSAIWAPTSRVFPEACQYGKPAPFDQSTQYDIQVFTIQQCIFHLDIKGLGAAFLKKQT